MDKRLCILFFPKKGDLGITKNYRAITLTAIAAQVYNDMFLNLSNLRSKKFLRKIRTAFRKMDPQVHRL